jgi:hypothetical protein
MTVFEAIVAAFKDGLDRGAIAVLEAPDLLDHINDDDENRSDQ